MKTSNPFPKLLLAAAFVALAGGAVGQSKPSKPAPKTPAPAGNPAATVKLSVAKPNSSSPVAVAAAAIPAPNDPAFDPNLPAHERAVRLFSRDGRHLDARLISMSGPTVTVERLSDHRQFSIPVDSLDAPSVKRVESWVERDPEAIDFSLQISAKKRLVETDTFESQGRTLKTTSWVYDIVLANQSRNDLSDAEVEYRIIYNDDVEFVKSAMYPGKGNGQRDGEAVDLPNLPFNGRAEFTTPPIDMQAYEFVPVRGEREFFRDEITGIWVRVIRNDRVIAEYQSNPASMHKLAWEGKEGAEIKIHDSFEDQFEENRR